MNQKTLDLKDSILKNVEGTPFAKFLPVGNGDPTYELITVDGKEVRYFTVQLFFESSMKADIQAVEYFINHPEFSDDPRSYSMDEEHDFRTYIMSYGDVWLEIKAFVGGRGHTQRAKLSQMLEVGHADHPSESILDAIARIKAN